MKLVKFLNIDCIVDCSSKYSSTLAPVITLLDADTYERVATASVNISPDVYPNIPENHTFIKNYSENTGILDILIKADIVELTNVSVKSGFVTIPLCKIL